MLFFIYSCFILPLSYPTKYLLILPLDYSLFSALLSFSQTLDLLFQLLWANTQIHLYHFYHTNSSIANFYLPLPHWVFSFYLHLPHDFYFLFFTLSSLFSSQNWSNDSLALGLSVVWIIPKQRGLKFRFGFCILVSPICSRYHRFSWFLQFCLLLHTGKFSVFFDDSLSISVYTFSRSIFLVHMCCVVGFFFSNIFHNRIITWMLLILYLGFIFNLLCIQICIWIYEYVLGSV